MIPRVRYGRTELQAARLGLGGFAFGCANEARGWNPYTPVGRAGAIATIHAALDAGINYIDTAPSYGDGHSESIIGEALRGRRDRVLLATKVSHTIAADQVAGQIEASLRRLQTDYVELIQIHGGMFTDRDIRHIRDEGLLDQLAAARDNGRARFIGFTVEEPWTGRPLVATGRFDAVQVRYNLIHQGAALHLLDEARRADLGVSVMRPMTSGILERLAGHIAPRWHEADDLYEVALKFVLSDSRVHVANVAMRSPQEVARNAALAESFQPPFDLADLPRKTADIYRTEDEAAGVAKPA